MKSSNFYRVTIYSKTLVSESHEFDSFCDAMDFVCREVKLYQPINLAPLHYYIDVILPYSGPTRIFTSILE